MPNEQSIDLIVTPAALKQVDDLKVKIDASLDSFIKLTGGVDALMEAMAKSKGLPGLNDNLGKGKQKLTEMEKAMQDLISSHAKMQVAQSEVGKQLAVNGVLLEEEKRKNKEAAKETLMKVDAYGKLNKQYLEAQRNAKNMAVLYGQESAQAKEATAAANLYGNSLKKIDASVGQFHRNVGNYRDGMHSFNQVIREAPAFANSLQTGLMGISNNLPMFADEIKAARDAGQSFGTIFKGLAASLFSFGGIIVILTTLLTFLPQIVKAFDGSGEAAKKASKGTNEYADSLKSVEKAQLAGAQTAQEELVHLKVLHDAYTDVNKPMKERKAAFEEMQELYPDVFKNMKFEKEETAKMKKLYDDLTSSIIATAMARAAEKEIENEAKKLLTLKSQADALDKLIAKEDKVTARRRQQRGSSLGATVASDLGQSETEEKINETKRQRLDIDQEILIQENKIARLYEYISTVANKRPKKNNGDEGDDGPTELQKLLYEQIELRAEYDKQIEAARQKDLEDEQAGLKYEYDLNADFLKDQFDLEQEYIKRLKEAKDKERKDFEKAEEEYDKKQLERKKAIEQKKIELAQEALNTIFAIANGDIDRKKNGLQEEIDLVNKKKEAEIRSVTESTESAQVKADKIAVINAKAQAQTEAIERRKRELDIQRAKYERLQAISNVIFNTARGVSAALTSTPPNVPLSVIVGAIGALQLGQVIAQPIPKFAKGTDGSPEGLAWVGEQGTEAFITPSGEVGLTPNSATLTYLEKGTKIIPNHELGGLGNAAILQSLALNGLKGDKDQTAQVIAAAYELGTKKLIKAIKDIPVNETNITSAGLYKQVRNGASRTEYLKRNL